MLRTIAILLIGTFFFSALLTPLVYSGLALLLTDVPWPFSRVYDRVAMVVILIFVVMMRKEFALGELGRFFRREEMGVKSKRFATGFLVSALTVAVVVPYMVSTGTIEWKDRDVLYYATKFGKSLLAAIVISIIEESFFRVLVFRRLKEALSVIVAALVCSCVYGVAHFIRPVKTFVYEEFSLFAGFDYLTQVVSRMVLPGNISAFIGFLLVGLVLCFVIQRTHSLFLCVGLHAGWVIGIKMVKYSTDVSPGIYIPPGPGSRYFLLTQPAAWFSILVVFFIVAVAIKKVPALSAPEEGGK